MLYLPTVPHGWLRIVNFKLPHDPSGTGLKGSDVTLRGSHCNSPGRHLPGPGIAIYSARKSPRSSTTGELNVCSTAVALKILQCVFLQMQICLVGGLVAIFYFPIYWVSNHPNWLIFFRGVAQPPTRCCFCPPRQQDFFGLCSSGILD